MSRLTRYAPSPPQRRLAALVLVVVVALALSSTGTGPAGAQDGHEPDPQVVDAVEGYAQETDKGYDHVLRWMRVLKSLGALDGMTAAEAQVYAGQHLALRWDPVAAELRKLENGQDEPDPQVVAAVRGYAQETDYGYDHVLRWMRVLHTFGAIEDMTAAEAQGYADRGWTRWVSVAAELAAMEASTPASGALEVSIKASPTHPRPGEVATLSAVIANAPAGSAPSYQWELDAGGGRIPLGTAATASYGQSAGTMTFRVTVSYDTGESATATVDVEWTETPPNQALVVNTGAEWYYHFVGTANAPRGFLVWKIFGGIFSDPDGDELTYTASVADGQSGLVEDISTRLRVTANDGEELDYLFFMADADDDWKAVSPALPDPLTITVTLTATDPGGLSASVSGEFLVDWESHPALASAEASPRAVELTFDQDVQAGLTPGQFTVNVTNEGGTTGTVSVNSVSVDGAVVTLALASELTEGQTVSVDYAHDDDAPLTRAGGGGDNTPDFTGQAGEVSVPDPVVAAPGGLSLSPALDANGVPRASVITASWDPVPDAGLYRLRWRPDGAAPPAGTPRQAQGEPGTARKSGIPSGLFGDAAINGEPGTKNAQGGPSANSDQGGENQLDLPGDRTSADITLDDVGIWLVDLEVYTPDKDELITSYSETAEIRVDAWLNAQTTTVSDTSLQASGCQPRTIGGIEVSFARDAVDVTWNDPNVASITGYQYRFQRDGSFIFPARSEGDWHDIPASNADTTSFRIGVVDNPPWHETRYLARNQTNALWLRAQAGAQTYCFEHLLWIKPFDVGVPLITGLEAYQRWDDGPNQLTLFWDDPGVDNLGYDFWYAGITPDWMGYGGRFPDGSPRGKGTGWLQVRPENAADPVAAGDGKLRATLSGIPCDYDYFHVRIRATKGSRQGPITEEWYVDLASTFFANLGDNVIRGEDYAECFFGLAGNDRLYGNGGGDWLHGGPGRDQLHGGDGDDRLTGGPGADELHGGDGNDRLTGGPDADELHGGPGADWADYTGSSAWVWVLLSTQAGAGGDAQGDRLTGIENLIGSRHNDRLTGDSRDNILRGGAGGDTLNGGDGIDTADYSGSPQGVTVNLGTSVYSGGHAQGDSLTNIENLTGSAHDDTLTGDDGDNILTGGAGTDTMDGGGGVDTVDYSEFPNSITFDLSLGFGPENDIIVQVENVIGSNYSDLIEGDADENVLYGGPGDDTLEGGFKNDKLIGGPGNDTLIRTVFPSDTDNEEFYFYPDFDRDTIRGFQLASDTIYLCDMEGVEYTGIDGSNGYYISVYAMDEWWPGYRAMSFQGSITLEGVSGLGYSNNTPAGNLNIIVASHCDVRIDPPPSGKQVGNTAKTTAASTSLTTNDLAQAFTTGSQSSGYMLTSVKLDLTVATGAQPTFSVSIRKGSNGAPGAGASDNLGTLTHPTGSLVQGLNTFTAPVGIFLAANTTYWVLIDATAASDPDTVLVRRTASTAEDGGGAAGWSIGDTGLSRGRTSTGAWTSTTPREIEIHGYAIPSDEPPQAVFTLTSNLGQPRTDTSTLSSVDVAQRFRTGSHAGGYGVTAVKLNMQVGAGASSSSFTVSIHKDAGGSVRVGDELGRLTNPGTLVTGENTFRASGDGIDLEPGKTYYVVVESSPSTTDIRVDRTNTNGEDPSSRAGWDIDRLGRDKAHVSTTWAQEADELQIAIVGIEK